MFKIKDGCKLELKLPETIKLFGSTKKLIDKIKSILNNWKMKKKSLEVVTVVLVKCNFVDNQHQQTIIHFYVQ